MRRAYENIFGYSRAVAKNGQVHVSGTCAPAPHEGRSAYDQATAALAIIKAALTSARADLGDVVRTVVYLRNIEDADQVAKAHLEVFDAVRPASTLVQVTSMLARGNRGLCNSRPIKVTRVRINMLIAGIYPANFGKGRRSRKDCKTQSMGRGRAIARCGAI
ncbi:Rid family hydrolase [Bradyrhizobium sp. CCBAU 45389]|uniref:Rid family hydrolase n=1 Tax=Bradyrhizobium sp. CCBAU 45389 TaxID=858429 RepID=UPI002FE159FA